MTSPSIPTWLGSGAFALGALAFGLAALVAYRTARGRRQAKSRAGVADPGESIAKDAPTTGRSEARDSTGAIGPTSGSPSAERPARRPRPEGPIEVLLAEDNDVNALVLTRHLEKLGCRVTRAATGADAVTAAGKGAFEIIFMDWRMPEMDGLEAIRHIRRIEGYSAVPIVAVTANALPGDRETCLRGGADEYVTKPVDASLLRATLVRFGLVAEPA